MARSMMDCFESLPENHGGWAPSDQTDVSPAAALLMSQPPFTGVHHCLGFGWDRAELCCRLWMYASECIQGCEMVSMLETAAHE